MASVRIYYDQATTDYNLWYFQYLQEGDTDNLQNKVFPDNTSDLILPFFPRDKVAFNSDGYVDVEINDSKYLGFYIKRNDGMFKYGGELAGTNGFPDGPTCPYQNDYGYIWLINKHLINADTFYVKELSPYVFRDSAHTQVVPQQIQYGNEYDDGTEETDAIKVFLTLKDYVLVDNTEDNPFRLLNPVLYLLNKSFDIGDTDMDFVISSADLNAEKADAKEAIEKNIANSLYKLGLDPVDFDESAFLADVAGFKADYNVALHDTIDFLKSCLDRHALLS
tara:strand:- start:6664 stop:7500 length:837 start_codon:yes stop_codon:yes gene_type:complete